jgi:tRNA A37 methylthiotransferase MiaB
MSKTLDIKIDPETLSWITKVKTYQSDVDDFKQRIKTANETLVEKIENTIEHEEVAKLEEQLRKARENLKYKLMNKSDYVELLGEKADLKDSLSAAKKNLSDTLLGYFHKTGEQQIEISAKEAREVILTGKLGKEKEFQTSLFSKAKE